MDCGGHNAESCSRCPFDEGGASRGRLWCNGVCFWLNGACTSREVDGGERNALQSSEFHATSANFIQRDTRASSQPLTFAHMNFQNRFWEHTAARIARTTSRLTPTRSSSPSTRTAIVTTTLGVLSPFKSLFEVTYMISLTSTFIDSLCA